MNQNKGSQEENEKILNQMLNQQLKDHQKARISEIRLFWKDLGIDYIPGREHDTITKEVQC